MSAKKLLPYLIVLLVVAGGFLISELYQSRQAAQDKAAKKIFAVSAENIKAITFKRDHQEVELAKDKNWQIVKPIKTPGADFTINSLAETLAGLEKQRELEVESGKLAEYGLDHPCLTVEFTIEAKAYQVRIGDKVPGGRGYYAQSDPTGKVLLISAVDKEALDKDLMALRDKKIFSFSADQVKELQIQTGKLNVDLERTGSQTWTLKGQPKTRIRSDKVASLIRQLSSLQAQEFVSEKPENLKKYGLAPKPAARLTVSYDKQQETLLLGAEKDKLCYAHKSGTSPITLVNLELLTGLPTSWAQLEDRRLWSGTESDVEKLTWGTPNQQYQVIREKDALRLTLPDGRVEKKPIIRLSSLLWRLKELEYQRLVPADRFNLKDPDVILQLYGAEDKLRLKLEAGKAQPADQLPVRATQGDQTLNALVSARSFANWRQELDNLLAAPSPESSSQ
ncbi:MAG: DUF4340 domain-containing protein [Desulfobacca sp.]|nr:DUF4340 domain-containing protein [Desulfobacca sp.]